MCSPLSSFNKISYPSSFANMIVGRVSWLFLCAFLFTVLTNISCANGWGKNGHFIVCRIAQPKLNEKAAAAVKDLLPGYVENDLASLCSWADAVKFRFHWSSPLHYIDTPDTQCSYAYQRDCKNQEGEADMCVSGAIKNYTTQLQSYSDPSLRDRYNLTQALLFLSHFVGDIHQPLHVGFTSDKGGNTIDVEWYTRKTVLHHVWDDNLVETAIEQFYGSDVQGLIDELKQNITGGWADRISVWEKCGPGLAACPDTYASESVTAACNFAYKGVDEGTELNDDYFMSRLSTVYLRLAEGGVRLAATLNRALSG